ncbi:MAG: IPT/TIG domain-containing protein, partial [Bdellovibrionales bacterium]|nr:IPT/TIG domain-containing protein [Bdellovibrionales bacterium]
VTLTGTGFITGASVFFGQTACDQINVVSTTSITCVTPAQAASVSDIKIINNDAQEFTLASAFTYRDPPLVSTVSPSSGALAGGTEITVSGSRFYNGALSIEVGGVACTSPTFVDSTTLTCTTGANTEGLKAITVFNPDGQSGTKPSAFTYQPGPSISSVSPIGGNYSGGTFITISGSIFRPGINVKIGGVDCNNISYIDANTVTCITPSKIKFFEIETVAEAGLDGKYFIFNFPNSSTAIWFDINNSGTAEPAHGATDGLEVSTVNTGDDAITVATKLAAVLDAQEFFEASSNGNRVALTYTVQSEYSDPTAGDSGFTIHTEPASDIIVTNTDNQSSTLADSYTYRVAPTLSLISPSSGKITGGDVVTITGTGFLSGATVEIGSINCGSLSVDSETQITCTIGAQSAGVYNVTVTNPDEQTASLFSSFTYKGPPVISSITPSAGAIAGGTPVQISGSEFVNGITATIGGLNCDNVTFVNEGLINCTTTGTSTGLKDVVVQNPDTQTATLVGGFTYRAAPVIGSFSPNGGNPSGATEITINGSNFFPGVEVTINDISCSSLLLVSASTITCLTPAQTGSYPIVVTNNDFQSVASGANYNYQNAPSVNSLTTPSGVAAGPLSGGSTLTINGADFLAGAVVNLGGSNCPVSALTSNSITCTTPAGSAGFSDLIITNSDNQTVNVSNAFEYRVAPTLTSISPVAGALGGSTLVTLTGTDFRGVTDVYFDGISCSALTQLDSTTVECITPAHAAGAVNITLVNEDDQQTILNNAYTYQSGPSLSSISPVDGPVGGATNITVSGSNFLNGATAKIGNVDCLSTTYVSSSDLICLSPAQAAGVYDITVTNPDNQIATLPLAFTYLEAPLINSPLVPDNGSIDGGTILTIDGQYFLSGATVNLSGAPCSVTSLTDTQIICTTTARTSGLVDITITNPDGQSGTLNGAFTYNPAPTISSITPTLGPSTGSTLVQ